MWPPSTSGGPDSVEVYSGSDWPSCSRQPNPTTLSSTEFEASRKVTSSLYTLILAQNPVYSLETIEEQVKERNDLHLSKRTSASDCETALIAILPPDLQLSMELAQEKGASNWLSVLPVEEFGLTLHKGAFRDALALRYG